MRAILDRLLARPADRERLDPLYAHAVRAARRPHWYAEGSVPDTPTGRFDMLASVVAMLLLRLEAELDRAGEAALLTELFIDDMDGQLRQWGAGDLGVGKQVGRLVSTLGGRVGALRAALAEQDRTALIEFARRNIYRDLDTPVEQAARVAERLLRLWITLAATSVDALLGGGGDW